MCFKGMIRGKRQTVDSVLYQSQCFYGQFGREVLEDASAL
jgi:hypothetical protein